MIETKVSGSEILRTVVGSGVHGIAIEGTDDHDEMGVFIEPPEVVLGLAPTLDHVQTRTQPEGVRSGPGDTDLIQYALRKYLRLAVQGNPTILIPLYAPQSDVLRENHYGAQLRKLREFIVSQRCGPRFLGYMDRQILRMKGELKRPTTRTDLIEKHGYDTKFASHAIRLGLQGEELMATGNLTLPMPGQQRGLVREIKLGRWTEENVLKFATELREELRKLVDKERMSALPEKPDYEAINAWSIGVHTITWRKRGWK